MAFTIKQHDTRPAYIVTLLDNFGTPSQTSLDLTTATQVKFKMRAKGSTAAPKVDAVMDIVDAPNGKVRHIWTSTDTDTSGDYNVEFEITWSDGGVETIPNADYLVVTVVDDLDSP